MSNGPEGTMGEENRVKALNRWLFALVGFMVIYSLWMLTLIDQKTEMALQQKLPITILDLNPSNSNQIVGFSPVGTNLSPKPLFEQKDIYNVGEYIVVNFFYVRGIIVEKKSSNLYRVIYKDHSHVLRSIVLPKEFLLSPTSYNASFPPSLLGD